jgi:hypothetical protein
MDEEMILLVSRLAEYLRMSKQQLQCFNTYGSQVEGWFKGELICFLDREKLEGRLHDFGRERNDHGGDNGKKVDIMLEFDNMRPLWVELKHFAGHQDNKDYPPSWYFNPNNHNYIKSDVDKLLKIEDDSDKFILVLYTPNPGSQEWNAGVTRFNANFPQPSVCSLTNPDDYPEYFFLGLLRVSRGDQH